jgi:hypothetical protein
MPRKYYACALFVALLGAALFGVARPTPGDLDISPAIQQTPVWCWAASAEMVLTYYDIPDLNPVGDFQCAIAALVSPPCLNNCANCLTGAPNMSYLRNVLQNYPAVAARYSGQPVNRIVTDAPTGVLSKDDVMSEIDADRPIVVGISPGGFTYGGQPEHVSVIVGYDDSDDDNFLLTVNDPFGSGRGPIFHKLRRVSRKFALDPVDCGNPCFRKDRVRPAHRDGLRHSPRRLSHGGPNTVRAILLLCFATRPHTRRLAVNRFLCPL